MVLAELVHEDMVIKGREEGWTPDVPRLQEQEISDTESFGAKARALWEEELVEFAEIPRERMEVLYTGIGGGIARQEGSPRIWQFGDTSRVPGLVDLRAIYRRVPELLLLVASPLTTEDILCLKGVAREYKEEYGSEELRGIIAILTSLPHERQDHKFPGKAGRLIPQVTTLKDVVNVLVEGGDIDGGLLVGGHSKRSIEFALRKNWPLIPIDTYRYLVNISGFDRIPRDQLFIMGPDKGRRNVAKMLAAELGCPFASAIKIRDKENEGYPSIFIDTKVLKYIKDNQCIVAVIDDEIREGGTVGELAKELDGFAESMKVCVFKPIFAAKKGASAVDHLSHPLIDQVIVTDAVEPITNTVPIQHKLKVYPLRRDIDALTNYLRANLVRPGDPNWLHPSKTGTLLGLDLTIETYD